MAEDIVTRLQLAEDNGICEWQVLIDAADEIKLLRKALALAVGELSTHSQYQAWQPEQLMNQFLDEACNE